MYHIKEDKRSKVSAAMLSHALMALLQEKPLEKISVTELVGQAMVGRSTFYRNFDEIVDVLWWECDTRFQEVLQGYLKEGSKEGLGLLEYVFGYWQKNAQILEILLAVKRMDIIYECFVKNSSEVMEQCRETLDLPQEACQYFISIRISILIGTMKTWIDNGKKETAGQLSRMLGRQLTTANRGLLF